MIIDTEETIKALAAAQGDYGAFQHLIINASGTFTAVYSGGCVQFDKDGKSTKVSKD